MNRHTVDVKVSNYMLQDYLAAFRSAVKAGAKGLMCRYGGMVQSWCSSSAVLVQLAKSGVVDRGSLSARCSAVHHAAYHSVFITRVPPSLRDSCRGTASKVAR